MSKKEINKKSSRNDFSHRVMKIIEVISELDKSQGLIKTREYYAKNGTFEGIEEYLKSQNEFH